MKPIIASRMACAILNKQTSCGLEALRPEDSKLGSTPKLSMFCKPSVAFDSMCLLFTDIESVGLVPLDDSFDDSDRMYAGIPNRI